MRTGAKVLATLSVLLLLFLLVGLLLPGTWRAEAGAFLKATPKEVFPFIHRLGAWEEWTPFPDTGLEPFGPPEGVGAGVRWDDPSYGKGEARILASRPNEGVEYEVRIEGGKLLIRGRITLQVQVDGTRITWIEEGDFGWNPLLGYTARSMASSQGEAMRASLERLAAAVAGRNPPPTSP
jgi:hypothetical protein